jgi:FtsZ-interacting cell division protein ZipA
MAVWLEIMVAGLLAIVIIAIVWLWLGSKKTKKVKLPEKILSDVAEKNVEHIFDDDFREELRNRGRLHFEKIIGENAMFLQQDLRLTTSQLNDYMKDEIKKVLQEEFSKYEESISTAKDLALDTIQKTQSAIEQQRTVMEKQMSDEVIAEKARIIAHFEKDMADIINHYILLAIGDEIDLTNQLDYIFQYLEDNKAELIEDIKSGS